MGSPGMFYHRALQYFAHGLIYMQDTKMAKELFKEESVKKLEEFIQDIKPSIPEKRFYFDAGRTEQCVIEEAYEMGTDPLNASIAGLDIFEEFIGLDEEIGGR